MKRMLGLTLVELLIVVALIAVLASILFPVFANSGSHCSRQTTCLSNVRQMCTAVAMYIQDNSGKLPSEHWTADLANGGVNAKMYACPTSNADASLSQIAYGYNSLLIQPNGKGISEQQMRNPSEIGVICDAGPIGTVGGLIGGGVASDMSAIPQVTPSYRHVGIIAGFADGHAKYLPATPAANDYSDPVNRAFYMVVNIGLVDPVGGGVGPLPAGKAGTVTLGGDGCTAPLLIAAAKAWAATNAKSVVETHSFLGQFNTTAQQIRGKRPQPWYWGCGDGLPNGAQIIGHDVMVIIANPQCKIPVITGQNDREPTGSGIAAADQVYAVSLAQVAAFYATGYSVGSVQAYTYDAQSGSRAFFGRAFGVKTVSPQCVTVEDDREMQDKVAADPYGIGYMSGALVDQTRVQVLGLRLANGTYQLFPQADGPHRWLKPASYVGYLGYRDLYVRTSAHAAAGPAAVLTSAPFLANPLYRLGYAQP